MNYLFTFHDLNATRVELSGGKGSNLSILSRNGFPVPPGFIVTAQAYRDFVAGGGAMIREVTQWAGLPAERPMRAKKLQEALQKLPLPQSLEKEVRSQLKTQFAGQAVSVRSSSTMEDLASAAFAGQHETFLNCSVENDILEKIKACYLSLWSDRAIAYRHQQGFDHQLAAMAVVVQQMIQCDVAGVGFSINPVSGDPGEMVIDANFGLGESVVSGDGEVDHFTIDKATQVVRTSDIAIKTRKVIGVHGGTEEIRLPETEGSQPCLGPQHLAQLSHLMLQVEASFRFPQDIEWGFANAKLWLLQSRPVTTIPARWTRDESAERFPNVITPLTWDFVETGFHRSLSHSFRLMGFPPFNGKWFGMHGHYVYGNQNVVELYGGRAPFMVRNLDELRAAIPQLKEEFRWVQQLPVSWTRDLDFYLQKLGEFQSEPLEKKPLREVWSFILAVQEHGASYFRPNIAISITHSTLYRLLGRLLVMALGSADTADLLDRLTAFCETKTGAINKELFELAALVKDQPELHRLFTSLSSRDLLAAQELERFPEFHARFQEFLRSHGHREMDFDAYVPTWLEAPWIVLDNIRLVLQTPMDRPPSDKERELKIRMQQAEVELYQRLPLDLHFFFSEVIRLARLYTSLDDLEHYQTTRFTLSLRRGLRELGNRLVEWGILSEPMDIFFAHVQQIEQAISVNSPAAWQEFSATVDRQKEAYLLDKSRRPEWVLGETNSDENSGDSLAGLPGSAGQAEGPVFIVRSPEDFALFPKGAVLVARTTNPTWTPLFYCAAAVLTESGGPLSHGAVTAREMRIPAVMSVKHCLSRLKNGQHVRVDGTRGKVYLTTPASHPEPIESMPQALCTA